MPDSIIHNKELTMTEYSSSKPLESGRATLVSVSDLLKMTLTIPPFQRPYDWRAKQVEELILDLQSSSSTSLFLGLVVLVQDTDGAFSIVDGQQRITSLYILLSALGERASAAPKVREEDRDFLRKLTMGPEALAIASPDTLSQHLMKSAAKRMVLCDPSIVESAKRATCIAYVAPQLGGATTLFERINMRGRDVSQFDLVKNRLIGWLPELDRATVSEVQSTISKGYDRLYRILSPRAPQQSLDPIEYDVDRLLRVHWILYTSMAFSSSDRVIDSLEKERADIEKESVANGDYSRRLKEYIQKYIDSLTEVALKWMLIQDPAMIPKEASVEFGRALFEFSRLDRFAELEPMIVAVALRYGMTQESGMFVRLCTISSLRDIFAKRRGNRGRSPKWTIARGIYQKKLVDALGRPIVDLKSLANHFFWKTFTWWDVKECTTLNPGDETTEAECSRPALGSSNFYNSFRLTAHYLFWEYELALSPKRKEVHGSKNVQAKQFLDEQFWKTFRSRWDIEHIFPRTPDHEGAKKNEMLTKLKAHEKKMNPWLNHLGNLTIVPLGENRGLLSNSDFEEKRGAMLDRGEVQFNELLTKSDYIGKKMDGPFWGPNNCRKRSEHLTAFADWRWGTKAVQALGVRKFDSSVDFESEQSDDQDED